MKWKNCFAKLSFDDFEIIQKELQEVLSEKTKNYTNWSKFKQDSNPGWMYLDKETAIALTQKPNFSAWLKENKIYPQQYSIIVVNENLEPVRPHIDHGPNAKINVPVLNNDDWYNRWFDDQDNCISETDLNNPIVFNSYVKHDVVYKGDSPKYPRIILSITIKNDEMWEQKYLID